MGMYHIILYQDGKVLECFCTDSQPIVEGDTITWNNGLDKLSGINVNYVVVEGEWLFEKDDPIPQEVIQQDIKDTLISELERLKRELEQLKQKPS
jgi:hypothetical protein